jgi:hypothetical protein
MALRLSLITFRDQLTSSGFNRSRRITTSLTAIALHCQQLQVRNPLNAQTPQACPMVNPLNDFSQCALISRTGLLSNLIVPSLDFLAITEPQDFINWLPTRIELQTDERVITADILTRFTAESSRLVELCPHTFPTLASRPPSSEEILFMLIYLIAQTAPEYLEAFPFTRRVDITEQPLLKKIAYSTNLDLPLATWLTSPHCVLPTDNSSEYPIMITLACIAITVAAIFEQDGESSLLNSIPEYYISKFINPRCLRNYLAALQHQHKCDRTGTGSAAFRLFTTMCATLEAQIHAEANHVDPPGLVSHYLMSDLHKGLLDTLFPDLSA